MIGNYERILGKIAKSSGLEKEEVERRIEAKRAKLSGLISKEGAAQVIAAELGVSFDDEKLKIEELLPGMRRANVVGKVLKLFSVRSFVRNGKEGKVANLAIADETSNIKVVLWDTHHIELIEKGLVKEGSIIEIVNATVRDNEIHLGSFSEFKLSKEILEDVKTEVMIKETNISDFKIFNNVKTRAFIVQIFEPRFFEVCSECKKKITKEGEDSVCAEHGKVICEKRGIVNLVIDDGTENIRAVAFHDNLKDLGFEELENPQSFLSQKENLLGKEMFFMGTVRNNKFFNNSEFIISGVEEVDIEKLIQKLEKE